MIIDAPWLLSSGSSNAHHDPVCVVCCEHHAQHQVTPPAATTWHHWAVRAAEEQQNSKGRRNAGEPVLQHGAQQGRALFSNMRNHAATYGTAAHDSLVLGQHTINLCILPGRQAPAWQVQTEPTTSWNFQQAAPACLIPVLNSRMHFKIAEWT
jgi:hypothetical protein